MNKLVKKYYLFVVEKDNRTDEGALIPCDTPEEVEKYFDGNYWPEDYEYTLFIGEPLPLTVIVKPGEYLS